MDVGAFARWSSNSKDWDYDGDADRFPTVAYTWASVDVFTAPSMGRYKSYINELDTLTHHQVIELS